MKTEWIKDRIRNGYPAGCLRRVYLDDIQSLLNKVEELEGYKEDALYLRKWREIKHSNPELPCACQVTEEGEILRWCEVHKEWKDKAEVNEAALSYAQTEIKILEKKMEELEADLTREAESRAKGLEATLLEERANKELHVHCEQSLMEGIKKLKSSLQRLRESVENHRINRYGTDPDPLIDMDYFDEELYQVLADLDKEMGG